MNSSDGTILPIITNLRNLLERVRTLESDLGKVKTALHDNITPVAGPQVFRPAIMPVLVSGTNVTSQTITGNYVNGAGVADQILGGISLTATNVNSQPYPNVGDLSYFIYTGKIGTSAKFWALSGTNTRLYKITATFASSYYGVTPYSAPAGSATGSQASGYDLNGSTTLLSNTYVFGQIDSNGKVFFSSPGGGGGVQWYVIQTNVGDGTYVGRQVDYPLGPYTSGSSSASGMREDNGSYAVPAGQYVRVATGTNGTLYFDMPFGGC